MSDRQADDNEIPFLPPHFEAAGFPWRHIIGYAVSLVLTAISLWLVADRIFPPVIVIAVILSLATVQIAVQLGFFMHLRESRGTAWHLVTLSLGLFFAFAVIAGSIWAMAFKSGVS